MIFLLIPLYGLLLVGVVWIQTYLVVGLVKLAIGAGVLLTAAWVLGNVAFQRVLVRRGLTRLALAHDRLGMYTALYQGLVFATLTLSAVGVGLTWYKEGTTGPMYLFDVCLVSTWIATIIISFCAGFGLIAAAQDRLPKTWLRKILNPPLIAIGLTICFGPPFAWAIFGARVEAWMRPRVPTSLFFALLNAIYLALSVAATAWWTRNVKEDPPAAA